MYQCHFGWREREEREFESICKFLEFLIAVMDFIFQKIDGAILLIVLQRLRRRRQQKEEISSSHCHFWMHPIVSQHLSLGYFTNLYAQLHMHPAKLLNFTRMSIPAFDDLLERLRPRLARMDI